MAGRDWLLAAVVVTLLGTATIIGQVVQRQPHLGLNAAAISTFNRRVRAWIIICALLAIAFFSPGLTVALFGLMSFWALREFITLTPTRLGDHRALFWVFFIFTPLQYVAVAFNNYAFYSIWIPVYAFLFIPARIAMAGDFKRFLERVAKIQSGLLICVYCLSFAPALLYLDLSAVEPGTDTRAPGAFIVLLRHDGIAFRSFPIRLEPTVRTPRNRPSHQCLTNLGGLGRWIGEHCACWSATSLGNPVPLPLADRVHVCNRGCNGLCRRNDDVRH